MTREDLAPGYQLVQTAHAIADFGIQYPKEIQQWHSSSNYLACLSVKDEPSLLALHSRLLAEGIKHSVFREPDVGNEITAIAIEPSIVTQKICSSFPLALKNYKNGLNKNNYEQI